MTKQEAAKLLALIKVAYPASYRDMDDASKIATVNMWHISFSNVPYPIMEQAFNHFRMISKFPPTVAEMAEELRRVHYQALEQISIHQMLGNDEAYEQCRLIVRYTDKYKDLSRLCELNINRLNQMGLTEGTATYRQALPKGL